MSHEIQAIDAVVNIWTPEALANRRQHTLHGLCRCPAQVQGQAEITKKKRQLRHGLFVHGDQSG